MQGSALQSLVNQTAIDDLLDMVFKHKNATFTTSDFLDTVVDVNKLLDLLANSSSGRWSLSLFRYKCDKCHR